jgi:site-specific DNA recombinase
MTNAGIWLRVSTNAQDEASQLPDIQAWCDCHEYDVKREYLVHGKSAYHGKHQKTLDEMFSDMESGAIEVLVVWKQDRIERRGMEAALNLISRAKQAGGRIEFATEPHLNKLNDMGGRISYVLMAEVANQESKNKSDRILAKQKALAPRDDEAEVVKRIFVDVASGIPVSRVAQALHAEGIRTRRGLPFSEKVMHEMITNPVYRGLVTYQGKTYMRVMPLVASAIWLAANQAVKSRVQSKATATGKERRASKGRPEGTYAALLKPVCGQCGGPMYAYNRNESWATYRCAGLGPNGTVALRKGCGVTIKVDILDAEVTQEFLAADDMEVIETFTPGTDYTEDIARTELAIRDLDLDAEDYDEQHANLRAELKRLKALKPEGPRVTTEATGRSEGDAFKVMDPDQRRAEIRRWTLTVYPEGSQPRWELSGGPGQLPEGAKIPDPQALLTALRPTTP